MRRRQAGVLGVVVAGVVVSAASVGWACVPGHDHTPSPTTVTTAVPADPPATAAPAEPPVTVLTTPASDPAPAPAPATEPTPAATPMVGATPVSGSISARRPSATPAATTPATTAQAPATSTTTPATAPATTPAPVTTATPWSDTVPTAATSSPGEGISPAALGLFAAGAALVLVGLSVRVRGRRVRRPSGMTPAGHHT